MTPGSWRAKLHGAADRVDRRFGTSLRATGLTSRIWTGTLDRIVALQSDRSYMRKTILPALARARPRRILFVGVRGYTRSYPQVFRGLPVEFWTADIDPSVVEYGSPSRHVTEDLRNLHEAFPPAYFDVAMLNGVFGWGINSPEDMARALAATAVVLGPEGALLIGWNSDGAPDLDTVAGIELFQPAAFAGLPQRKTFHDVTHVYAWYRKRPHEGTARP